MKSRPTLRKCLALLGGIPLLLSFPYIINAWKTSPLDGGDCLFAAVFVVSAIFALVFTKTKEHPQFQPPVLVATLIFLGIHLFCHWIGLNAGAIASAILFWWFLLWLTHDATFASNLLPSFLILLLATVSSTYWLSVFLGVNTTAAFGVKVVVMILLLSAEVLVLWKGRTPRLELVLFAMGMAAAAMVLFQLGNVTTRYAPLLLEINPVAGDFIGREMEAAESFRRFFQKSDAHHYRYVGREAETFSLLSVKCGADIHEIHPASHCLKSSGWTIDEEHPLTIEMTGNPFCVTEVKGHRGQITTLLWVWYSTPDYSTGNFINFRRCWTPKEQWTTYQFGIYGGGNIERQRERLLELLTELKKNNRD